MLVMNKPYFPAKDRSFWYSESSRYPLLYLAWGTRNFHRQPIPITTHQGWVVAIIEEGNPLLDTGTRLIQTSPGSLIIIPAGDKSGWQMQDDRECRFLLWMWDSALPTIPNNQKTHIKLSKKEREVCKQHHEMCRKEVFSPDSWSKLYLDGCFRLFCSIIARVSKAPQSNSEREIKAVAATNWLQENINSQQPVARLCDYLNISQSSLYRLFQKKFNMSPKNYIHITRMELGKKMLEEHNLAIKETSFSLGYKHPNDFSRAFQKHFGKTCSSFKKTPMVHANDQEAV